MSVTDVYETLGAIIHQYGREDKSQRNHKCSMMNINMFKHTSITSNPNKTLQGNETRIVLRVHSLFSSGKNDIDRYFIFYCVCTIKIMKGYKENDVQLSPHKTHVGCVYRWVWLALIVSIKLYDGGINCEKVTIGAVRTSLVWIKLMFYVCV